MNACSNTEWCTQNETKLYSCGYESASVENCCLFSLKNWFYYDTLGTPRGLKRCRKHGSNVFLGAIVNDDRRLVTHLLRKGSEEILRDCVTTESLLGDTAWTLACKHGRNFLFRNLGPNRIDHETSRGKTAVLEAARHNRPDVVEQLVGPPFHARTDLVGRHGKSAYQWAVAYCDQSLDDSSDENAGWKALRHAGEREGILFELFRLIKLHDVDGVRRVLETGGENYHWLHQQPRLFQTLRDELDAAIAHEKVVKRQSAEDLPKLKEDLMTSQNHSTEIEQKIQERDHNKRGTEVEIKTIRHLIDLLKYDIVSSNRNLMGLLQQHLTKDNMDPIKFYTSAPPNNDDIHHVCKAFCLLFHTQYGHEHGHGSDSTPNSKSNGDTNQSNSDEHIHYWHHLQQYVRNKDFYHKLNFFDMNAAQRKLCMKLLVDIDSNYIQRGLLDYDITHQILLPLNHQEYSNQNDLMHSIKNSIHDYGNHNGMKPLATPTAELGPTENGSSIRYGSKSPHDDNDIVFNLLGVLAKWIKKFCYYQRLERSIETLEHLQKSKETYIENEDAAKQTLLQRHHYVSSHIQTLEKMVQESANKMSTARNQKRALLRKLRIAELLSVVTPTGHTLFSWACAVGNEEIVQLLVEKGSSLGDFGDDYNKWCATVIQTLYRRHRWQHQQQRLMTDKNNGHHDNTNNEKSYRPDDVNSVLKKLGHRMSERRSSVRSPLCEALYNGNGHVLRVLQRENLAFPMAGRGGVVQAMGTLPWLSPRNEKINTFCSFLQAAHSGKHALQTRANWDHGVGWIMKDDGDTYQQQHQHLDKFDRSIQAANHLVIELNEKAYRAWQAKQTLRDARSEELLMKTWQSKMEQYMREKNYERMMDCAAHGVDINYEITVALTHSSYSLTPLLVAAGEDDRSGVAFLLDRMRCRPLIDFETKYGHTALIYACTHGHIGAVEELLDRGANVNRRAENGQQWTALIGASYRDRHDVVRYLLERGAFPDVRDRNGKRALDWAYERGHDRTVTALAHFAVNFIPKVKCEFGVVDAIYPCRYGCGFFGVAKALARHEYGCQWRDQKF